MKEEITPPITLPGPTNVPDRVMGTIMKTIINYRGHEFEIWYGRLRKKLKYVFQTERAQTLASLNYPVDLGSKWKQLEMRFGEA